MELKKLRLLRRDDEGWVEEELPRGIPAVLFELTNGTSFLSRNGKEFKAAKRIKGKWLETPITPTEQEREFLLSVWPLSVDVFLRPANEWFRTGALDGE